jgi:lipopolysaccharide export system permease protein
MRLLDRYFLRELVVPLFYCLTGFLIFWLTFDLFGELGDLQKAELSPGEIGSLYLQKLPELLVIVIPVALLLAMLYALTNHSRHNELIAARAAGIGMWRLSVVYLTVGTLFSLLLFAVNEGWAARGPGTIEMIQRSKQAGGEGASEGLWNGPTHIEDKGASQSWDIENYNLVTTEMIRPRITWNVSAEVTVKMVADQGVYTNGVWTFKNLTSFRSDPGKPEAEMFQMESYPVLGVKEFLLTPRQVRSELRIASLLNNVRLAKEAQVSLHEISDYLTLHPDLSPAKQAKLDTQFHGRLAWPFTCLVVVLIAIPFGGGSGRRNAYVGVASSIVICFAYFILMRVGLALGTGGRLTPWLAAWLPNLLFGGGAGVLIARMR